MKTKSCRLLSLLLAVVLIAGVMLCAPITASATEDEQPYKVKGSCGVDESSDVEWYVFDDASMVIFGTGAIKSYPLENGNSTAPWFGGTAQALMYSVTSCKIVIESGITDIGDYAFYLPPTYTGFVQINSIDLCDTLTSIGSHAFYNQAKIEQIIIPPSVTYIGDDAFGGCTKLNRFDYFGNPDTLVWDGGYEFSEKMTVHILNTYSNDQVAAFNQKFAYKNIEFSNDLDNPYQNSEDGVDRNIALYYGATNSNVFAGGAPFIIVGKFDGRKKSTTHGSNGFVSVVSLNDNSVDKYYILTDIAKGELREATVNSSGRATGCSQSVYDKLSLNISHEYIGSNIVKVKYRLTNKTNEILSGIKLGCAGDIKIGADDTADIEPLFDESDPPKQVGFYMSSSKDYDKDSNEKYATLGFIGENVAVSEADADYFYGAVGGSLNLTASGARSFMLIPQRVFERNNNSEDYKSYHSEGYDQGHDSGVSFFWNNIELDANASKEYVVMFSVYGNEEEGNGKTMVEEAVADYVDVEWKNYDDTLLQKQKVIVGQTPVYTGSLPTKPSTSTANYSFSRWGEPVETSDGTITYTAQYNEVQKKFFTGHSLSLDGDIGVNFYLDIGVAGLNKENLQTDNKLKIKFERTVKGNKKTVEYPVTSASYDNNTGYYIAKCSVPAAEMSYNIKATAFIDGVEYTKEYGNYSVRQYGKYIIDNSSSFKPELVDLAKAMLDYGAKAQLVFNRTDVDMANKDINYTMQSHELTASNSDMAELNSSCGLQYYGSTMVFLTTTSLVHYYRVVGNSFDYDNFNNYSGFTKGKNGTLVCFEKENIPAAELDDVQVLTIAGQRFNYSALDFAAKLQQNGSNDNEKNLGTALYWYNHYANVYFKR